MVIGKFKRHGNKRVVGRSYRDVVVHHLQGDDQKGVSFKSEKNEDFREEPQFVNRVVIQGEPDSAMLEQLSRSIIGETNYPVNIKVMAEKLCRNWQSISKVHLMVAYETLVTFATV